MASKRENKQIHKTIYLFNRPAANLPKETMLKCVAIPVFCHMKRRKVLFG